MMSEWKKVSVSDLGRIVTGKTPKTAISEYYGGCIPFLTPSDDMSVKYVLSTSKTITEDGKNSVKNAVIPKNSICVSCIGSDLGKVVITTKETVTNQQINSIIVNTELYDVDFVYYAMVILGKVLNYHSKTSTAVPIVNKSTFLQYEILCPVLSEQRKIARILSEIDSKIAINTAINENLHQLIAAYYAEIFKKCEHTAKISDYADRVFSGGTPTTSNESYWSGEFKWLSSGETSQKYIVDTEKTITQAGVDNSSTRLAKKYDTVIASAGQGHTRGQTSMLLTDTYINQSIIVVESERIYMPFIYWNICGRYEELRVISNSNSIRGSLTTKMISAFTAPKADITQISRFSELAWAAIHEIEKNCNEIARLAALRDTLLPKLMNGEIDVSAVQV